MVYKKIARNFYFGLSCLPIYKHEYIITMEKWLPIKNYERYSVSNYGRVKNIHTGRILKPNIKITYSKKGEGRIMATRVGLWKGNSKRGCQIGIHRLVADAFLPKQPSSTHTIDHIDRNTSNNHHTNLRWATAKEQANNRVTRRSSTDKFKITPEELHDIYLRTKTETLKEIADSIGNISLTDLFKVLKYVHPEY